MSTTIASLLVKLGVSIEGAKAAQEELDGVTKSAADTDKKGAAGIKNFAATAGKAFAAVGAAAIAASVGIFKLVDSVTASADEIIKGAKVAGIGADEYQRLAFAAKISGADIQQVAVASKTVARGLNDAVTKGTGPFVEGLELVGLSLEDVANIPFEQQLGVFADAISNLDTESEKLAASQLLLGGRAGPKLATLLAEGSAGIKKLGDEAAATGGVLGGEALEKSAEFQDSITRLKTTVGGIVSTIAIDLAPMVQEMIDGFKNWTLANRELISVKLKGFLERVIPAIRAVGNAVGTVVGFIGDFIEAAGGADKALAIVTSGLVAFKTASFAAAGPFGAITAAFLTILPLAVSLGDELGDILFGLINLESEADKIRRKARAPRGAPGTIGSIVNVQDRKQAAALLKEQQGLLGDLEQSAAQPSILGGAAALVAQADVAGSKRRLEEIDKELGTIFATNQEFLASDEEAFGPQFQVDTPAVTRPTGRGRGAGRKKTTKAAPAAGTAEPTSDVTLAESLLAIRTGSADPKQIQQVIKQLARKTPSTKSIKPTVAIDFFNFVITQNIKGADPIGIGKESAKAIRGEFQKATAKTGQTIPTGVVR